MSEEWRPIGSHRARRQGDVLVIELHGNYSLEDCKIIYPMLAEMWAKCPDDIVIIDSTEMTGMLTPEVRRYVGEFGRQNFLATYRSVIICRSIVIRALVYMVVALSRIGRPEQGKVIFVADPAEAWQQVELMRQERQPAATS